MCSVPWLGLPERGHFGLRFGKMDAGYRRQGRLATGGPSSEQPKDGHFAGSGLVDLAEAAVEAATFREFDHAGAGDLAGVDQILQFVPEFRISFVGALDIGDRGLPRFE